MAIYQTSSAAETIVASCFELRFWWHEDRWRHEIVSTAAAASLPRVAAVEATVDLEGHHRIVSPTYQQIHLDEDRAAGSVRAFLVGQSGPHHFSAAFHVQERPHGAVVDVDVADRCLAPVEYLAATYHVEASHGSWTEETHAESDPGSTIDPAVAARRAIVLTCEHPHARLIFEADHPGRHLAEEAGHGSVRVQALAHAAAADRTHRFRYRWRWVNDSRPSLWDHAV